MMIFVVGLSLLAQAEPTLATPVTPAVAVSAPATIRLTKGTELEIELVDALSSKTSKLGEHFAIRLARPVVQDGVVVIPAGAIGHGEVIDAGKAGINGKQGKLIVSARELDINGQKARVRGMTLTVTGQNRVNLTMAMLAVPYAGLASVFVRGGDIEVPAGTKAVVHLAEDIDLPLPAAGAIPTGGTVQ